MHDVSVLPAVFESSQGMQWRQEQLWLQLMQTPAVPQSCCVLPKMLGSKFLSSLPHGSAKSLSIDLP